MKKEYIIFLAVNFELDTAGNLNIGQIHDKFWRHIIKDSYQEDFAEQPIKLVISLEEANEILKNHKKWKKLQKLLKDD